MTDLIALLILVLILGLAVAYIVKAKRRGVKCIGCPAGGKLSQRQKDEKKETGRTGDRQKDPEDLRHALRSLCDECDHDAEPH